jgi:putative tricarboxylic transport membrane protein
MATGLPRALLTRATGQEERTMRLLPLVAATVVFAGCGNDVDDVGSNWPRRDLKIMAAADPGGGWDTTAREMARVIEGQNVIDKSVEVYNVSGAGGTIGLAQLASKRSGESNQMMVMGLVMLGAIETNQAPLDVTDTTPIAALTSEPEAIVVRDESPIRDLEGLVEQMKADPSKVSFAGGSAGGTDQILLGLLAKAARSTRRRPSTSPTRAAGRPIRQSSRDRSPPASRVRRSSRIRSRAARCACSRSPRPSR